MRGRVAVVLYARVPEKGRVKTRLRPALDSAAALRLHAALVGDAAARVRAAARRAKAEAWVSLSRRWEPPARGPLATLRADLRGLARAPQRGPDLGARMRRTIRVLLAAGRHGVVIVGSDCPTLSAPRLVEACRVLRRGAPLVLVPADDGGYGLIGLSADRPGIFEGVPWGTGRVLAATLVRARRFGIGACLLGSCYDIDRPEDLERLRRSPRHLLRRVAPRTAAFLDALEAARAGRSPHRGRPSGARFSRRESSRAGRRDDGSSARS